MSDYTPSQPVDTDSGFPRISLLVWEVCSSVSISDRRTLIEVFPQVDIWISLVVALIAAGVRTYFRLRKFHRLAIDDCFLLLSAATFTGSIACAWLLRDNVYLQVEAGLGTIPFNPDSIGVYLMGDKLYLAASTLIWASLFSIKFSFMFFFQNLVRRVRKVEIYWWAVMAILVSSAMVNIFFGFFMCTDFTINFLGMLPNFLAWLPS